MIDPGEAFGVAGRRIGPGNPTFLIAEIGVNHNGELGLAAEMVRAAKRAGADCVKFQTFKAERVATAGAPKAKYQTLVTNPEESQVDMLRQLELVEKDHSRLRDLCEELDIVFCSTPYNEEDIEFLNNIGTPILKAASIHLAEPHFLECMARTGRPMILSTGMGTWEEIDRAVDTIRSTGNERFILLQCTTNYPSSIEDTNLRAMVGLQNRYGCAVGYSDHTLGTTSCLGAVALGATVIEKHFTLDRRLPGPDHTTSETPEGFAELVKEVRAMEAAMGTADKNPSAAERANMVGMRRSIVARRKIAEDHVIQDEDLICKRPATGIAPRHWQDLVGTRARRDIAEGAMLQWDDVDV